MYQDKLFHWSVFRGIFLSQPDNTAFEDLNIFKTQLFESYCCHRGTCTGMADNDHRLIGRQTIKIRFSK